MKDTLNAMRDSLVAFKAEIDAAADSLQGAVTIASITGKLIEEIDSAVAMLPVEAPVEPEPAPAPVKEPAEEEKV